MVQLIPLIDSGLDIGDDAERRALEKNVLFGRHPKVKTRPQEELVLC